MSRLRHELPPEILDNVLSRLPVHVLCRCRLVCRRWNHLLTQPGFASLYAQAPRRTPYVLISPKVLHFDTGKFVEAMKLDHAEAGISFDPVAAGFEIEKARNWEILDMAEKRFYTLSDSFIADFLVGRSASKEEDREDYGWDRYTLAADGGLIYALYDGMIQRHMICNPVRRSFYQIPAPGFRMHFKCYNHNIVVISVDTVTQSYKIVTLEAPDEVSSRREKLYLFDSATTKWRKLCKVPTGFRAWSCVFLKGVFYTLFVDVSMVPYCSKLYSCDLVTGAWSYIDVVALPQPTHLHDKAQLVVGLDRLFFVEYTGVPIYPYGRMTARELLLDYNQVWKKRLIWVTISEVLLAEKKVIKVVEAPKFSRYPQRMLGRAPLMRSNPVEAVGCGDWIVISSLLGRRVGFDLAKKCWLELPASTGHMYKHNSRRGRPNARQGMYAGVIDLDLRDQLIGKS